MLKMLVHQPSSTQKVEAIRNEDGSWLISKYWRKSKNEEWQLGKGIEFPEKAAKRLGNILTSNSEEFNNISSN